MDRIQQRCLFFSRCCLLAPLLVLPVHPEKLHGAESLMTVTSVTSLQIGGAILQIEFAGTEPDLPKASIIAKINQSAQAVAAYYGKFPVSSARIQIAVTIGGHGVLHGTTWGDRDGFPAVTRLFMGQHTAQRELDADWVVTHELVHMALASLPDSQHWLEEGVATYVEPIARSQSGQLPPEQVWAGMLGVCGMASRNHPIKASIVPTPGGVPIGAEPCFAWLLMSTYAVRQIISMACRTLFEQWSRPVAPSIKTGS